MFFPAFAQESPSMPPELIFTIEHLVSQLITTADHDFLRVAVREHRLARILWDELLFLGQVPPFYASMVQEYLAKQEPSLSVAVQRVLDKPFDATLRQKLCSPLMADKS